MTLESAMRTASWILLAAMAALTLLGSLASTWVAYSGARDEFGVGGPTLDTVAAWNPEIAKALRARRGTAAAYAAGFAVLLLAIATGPYRRGDRWAFAAVLAGFVVYALVVLGRVPALGTRLGVGATLAQAGVVALSLVLWAVSARRPA